MMLRRAVPVPPGFSGADVIDAWGGWPGFFALESGGERGPHARYSFFGYDPYAVLVADEGGVRILRGNAIERRAGACALDVMDALIGRVRRPAVDGFPFAGGAVGYLTYEYGAAMHGVGPAAAHGNGAAPHSVPGAWFGFYDRVLRLDHIEGGVEMCAGDDGGRDPERLIDEAIGQLHRARERVGAGMQVAQGSGDSITTAMDRTAYMAGVERVREYIRRGDIYQANFTQQFAVATADAPLSLYWRLREMNPAPFGAYLDVGNFQILSSSPELLLRVRGRAVETRPIKGTRPRGATAAEDRRMRAELAGSAKDRAELLMIVDLERNDLGRVCEFGSVRVEDLYRIESHATVHHTVASVQGRLRAGVGIAPLMRALFPGGSITGAPKIRAMQILAELEHGPRGIYTGALGYIDASGDCDFNLPIRTMTVRDGVARFGAGGGIVWDSDPALEYDEMLHKAGALMRALRV